VSFGGHHLKMKFKQQVPRSGTSEKSVRGDLWFSCLAEKPANDSAGEDCCIFRQESPADEVIAIRR
jgi:hypothetical protein